MGCGKTVQVMSLLAALFEKTGTGLDLQKMERRKVEVRKQLDDRKRRQDEALVQGRIWNPAGASTRLTEPQVQELQLPAQWWPVLIVVPPTLMENWRQEFGQFTHFEVACFDEKGKEEALRQVSSGMAEVMLMKRSSFQSEADFRAINSAAVQWKLVVIDEFHAYFKNVKGHCSKNLRKLKAAHEASVLGMTGTLMQNNHKELWNLVDLVETGLLGDWPSFKIRVGVPIMHAR